MMLSVLEIIAQLMLVVGSFLCLTGAIGMLRFPDFFSRIHATSVTETLGAGMILVALILLSNGYLEIIKLVLILLFLLITGPTAVHTLARAAITAGVIPDIENKKINSQTNSKPTSKR